MIRESISLIRASHNSLEQLKRGSWGNVVHGITLECVGSIEVDVGMRDNWERENK